MSAKKICIIGMFMAVICMGTLIFKIPMPGGYAHLGNGMILIAGVFLTGRESMVAAGIGSAMADVLGGYYIWIIPTLIIKTVMGYIAGMKLNVAGYILATIWMIFGYFMAGIFIMGSVSASLAQIPGLVMEGLAGIVLCMVCSMYLKKHKTDTK